MHTPTRHIKVNRIMTQVSMIGDFSVNNVSKEAMYVGTQITQNKVLIRWKRKAETILKQSTDRKTWVKLKPAKKGPSSSLGEREVANRKGVKPTLTPIPISLIP